MLPKTSTRPAKKKQKKNMHTPTITSSGRNVRTPLRLAETTMVGKSYDLPPEDTSVYDDTDQNSEVDSDPSLANEVNNRRNIDFSLYLAGNENNISSWIKYFKAKPDDGIIDRLRKRHEAQNPGTYYAEFSKLCNDEINFIFSFEVDKDVAVDCLQKMDKSTIVPDVNTLQCMNFFLFHCQSGIIILYGYFQDKSDERIIDYLLPLVIPATSLSPNLSENILQKLREFYNHP